MTRQLAPGERDPALRRDIIVEAAAEVIASQGLDDLALNRLARATRMPSTTIHSLFHDKLDIVLEICERHLDGLVAAAEAADLPELTTRRRLDAMALAVSKVIGERAAAHRTLAIGLVHLPQSTLRDVTRKQVWLANLFAEALAACLPEASRAPDLASTAVNALLTLLLADRPAPLRRPAYARFCVTCAIEALRNSLKPPTRKPISDRRRQVRYPKKKSASS